MSYESSILIGVAWADLIMEFLFRIIVCIVVPVTIGLLLVLLLKRYNKHRKRVKESKVGSNENQR